MLSLQQPRQHVDAEVAGRSEMDDAHGRPCGGAACKWVSLMNDLDALRRYGTFGESFGRALQVILATHVTFPMPRVRDRAGLDRHRMIRSLGRSQHTPRSIERVVARQVSAVLCAAPTG